jgi:hypothetical protein
MVAFGSNLAVSGENMPETVHLAAQEIACPGTRVLAMSRLFAHRPF